MLNNFLKEFSVKPNKRTLFFYPKLNKKLFLWSFDVSTSYHCKAKLTLTDCSRPIKKSRVLSSNLNLPNIFWEITCFSPFDRQMMSTLVYSLLVSQHAGNSHSSLSFNLKLFKMQDQLLFSPFSLPNFVSTVPNSQTVLFEFLFTMTVIL